MYREKSILLYGVQKPIIVIIFIMYSSYFLKELAQSVEYNISDTTAITVLVSIQARSMQFSSTWLIVHSIKHHAH